MSVIAPERTWRVKFYSLTNAGDWEEVGTGYTHFQGRRFACVGENDQKELLGYSVDQEVYRRQGKTIILWTTPELHSYALSFQHPDGAQSTIEHFCRLQDRDPADIEDEEPDKDDPPSLPDISTLPGLADAAEKFAFLHFQAKQHLADEVTTTGFLSKLEKEFSQAEREGTLEKLEVIFVIYKELVHCCHTGLTEELLREEHCQSMFGALECNFHIDDPAIRGKGMHFRDFLRSVSFRNLLSSSDPDFLSLVHLNYRLQYLKDTALARCLDENCIGFLTTFQLSLANEIIAYVTRSVDLRKRLVERLKEMDFAGFEMLGEIASMAKSVAAYTRIEFYEFLYSEGIVSVATKALAHPFPSHESFKVHAIVSDLLLCVIATLPARAKELFVGEEMKEESAAMVKAAAEAMLTVKEISAVQQLAEFMHSILEPSPDRRQSDLYDLFFESILPPLLAPVSQPSLPDEESRLLLCEILSLLTHCVQTHCTKIRFILLTNDLLSSIFKLLDFGDKQVSISVLKLIRGIVEKNDLFLIKHLVSQNLLQKVWTVFLSNGTRENMLFSSVLALIHSLKTTNSPLVSDHIAHKHLSQFKGTSLSVHFDFFLESRSSDRKSEPYALWNPREISAKEDEAYFEGDSSDEESDKKLTLKRKYESEGGQAEFEKKAKLES